MKQLSLGAFLDFKPRCEHKNICVTKRYVPAGLACMDCETLFYQYIPEPPEVLGYVCADWAWKHEDGREYTTQDPQGGLA